MKLVGGIGGIINNYPLRGIGFRKIPIHIILFDINKVTAKRTSHTFFISNNIVSQLDNLWKRNRSISDIYDLLWISVE